MSSIEEQVEALIKDSQVDNHAAQVFRNSTEHVKWFVVDQGGLHNARNPSSVLLARIKAANASAKDSATGSPAEYWTPAPSSKPSTSLAPEETAPVDDGPGYLRMRGLPYSATADDIMEFFDGFGAMRESIVIGASPDGRPSGDAFVEFPSVFIAQEALEERQKESLGGRYIELFFSNPTEAQRANSSRGLDGAPGDLSTITPDDVETFIKVNNIGDRAADALRGCPPKIRQAIVERGNLANARKPDSVLMARIRDAQKDAHYHSGGAPTSGDNQWRDNRWQERDGDNGWRSRSRSRNRPSQDGRDSEDVFRHLDPVLDDRPPEDSAINDFDDEEHSSHRDRAHVDLEDRLEEYIRSNNLDDKAVDALRECPPAVQEEVIERGYVGSARNPSSALLARIGQVRISLGLPKEPGNEGWQDSGKSLEEKIEDLIREHELDDKASSTLREAPPDVQQVVVDRGGLRNARNPSSVILSRLKDAQRDAGGRGDDRKDSRDAGWQGGYRGADDDRGNSYSSGYDDNRPEHRSGDYSSGQHSSKGAPSSDDVEDFIRRYEVDNKAADELRRCEPHVQERVLSKGLEGARNASSALVARIKQERNARGGETRAFPSHAPQGVPDGLRRDVENFISSNGLDDKAADALRECEPHLQQVVIKRGSLHNTRNPSSALLSRIRDAKKDAGPSGSGSWSRGDERYGDSHGYDRRSRSPRASRAHASAYGAPGDVEAFIRSNDIDDKAADALRQCHPDVQHEVMQKGVSTARNPSSALVVRIRDTEAARRAGGGGSSSRGAGSLEDRIEAWIANMGVDLTAADALRRSDRDLQARVLDRTVDTARNPSSALIALIRTLRQEAAARGGGHNGPVGRERSRPRDARDQGGGRPAPIGSTDYSNRGRPSGRDHGRSRDRGRGGGRDGGRRRGSRDRGGRSRSRSRGRDRR